MTPLDPSRSRKEGGLSPTTDPDAKSVQSADDATIAAEIAEFFGV